MKKPMVIALSLALLATLVAGCSDKADASSPPEISYGRDICLECDMIISEPRFAASYRLSGGETKSFDGIGELVKHAQRTGDFADITFAWVHDYDTEDWILVEEAHFVAGREIVTPMGHGIVAFSSMDAAMAFASEFGGKTLHWADLKVLPVSEQGLLGHHHAGDSDDHDRADDGSAGEDSLGDHDH